MSAVLGGTARQGQRNIVIQPLKILARWGGNQRACSWSNVSRFQLFGIKFEL